MRIYGPNGTTLGSPAASARRTSTTGFALPDDAASVPESRGPSAPKAAANIDALLAMQGVEDPLERRRRRWSMNYWVVHQSEMEAFAPVVARLAGH